MAKRKSKSKRSRTHPTRNQAASGSRLLSDTQMEVSASLAQRMAENEAVRKAQLDAAENIIERVPVSDVQMVVGGDEGAMEEIGAKPGDIIESKPAGERVAYTGGSADPIDWSAIKALDEEIERYYQEAIASGASVADEVREKLFQAVESAVDELAADGVVERLPNSRWRRTDYSMPPATVLELAEKVFPKAFKPPIRSYQRWEDAMIAQQRLYEFYEGNHGRRHLLDFEAQLNARHRPENRMTAGFQHATQLKMLGEAEPVWVSHDIVELVDHARHSWEVEPIRESDPFCKSAFCLLGRPILLDEGDGDLVPIRAIAWTSYSGEDGQGSWWISLYHHIEDLTDKPEAERAVHDYPGAGPLVIGHVFQWEWGTMPIDEDRLDAGPILDDDPELLRFRAKQQSALIQTLWRLGQQFVPAKRRAPRPQRRSWQRRMPRQLDDVTVITLRRQTPDYDAPNGDDPSWHYHVSFLVRGHWRNQPTREGIRQIWIKPYVKGQGPFKETVRAWEFTR